MFNLDTWTSNVDLAPVIRPSLHSVNQPKMYSNPIMYRLSERYVAKQGNVVKCKLILK